jgi:hypothetical protein
MLDTSVINQVNSVQQTDTTSDVAGAANVTPSYIAADVISTPAVEGTNGIDEVSVSTSIAPTQTASVAGTTDTKETTGYIVSDVVTAAAAGTTTAAETSTVTATDQLLSEYDMDSLAEVASSYSYLDPEGDAINGILSDLKAQGIITDGMSEEELLSAVNNYIATNYTYVSDAAGDHWQTVSETVRVKGGDCEDLANLEASLLIAALMDRGVSRADADSRVNCLVAVTGTGLVGHVWVKFTAEDGTTVYLNPAAGKVLSELPATQMAIFTYNSTSVNIISDYDWSKLTTASYDVDTTETTYIKTDYASLYKLQRSVRDLAKAYQTSINEVLAAVLAWKGGTTGFEAPSGTFEGLNHMDYYNALSDLSSAISTDIFQSKGTVSNSLGVINQMITLYGSQNAALNTALLSAQTKGTAYYSYIIGGVEYCNSTTTSFVDCVANLLNGYELQAWDLNLEVLKVSMVCEVINCDAGILQAQATLDSYNNSYSDLGDLSEWSTHWTLDGLTDYKTDGNCVKRVTDHYFGSTDTDYYLTHGEPDTSMIVFGSVEWEWISAANLYNYINLRDNLIPAAEKAVKKASEIRLAKRDEFRAFYNIPTDAELDAFIAKAEAYYLDTTTQTFDGKDYTYYSVNWEKPEFQYAKEGEDVETMLKPPLASQISEVEGMMRVVSLLYEARRDLRGLVEQELTGEQNDYKPMAINKLFAKKVDKLKNTLQNAITNILKATRSLNSASETNQETAINDYYDEKNADIQSDAPGTCEDDNREEDIAKQNKLRAGEIKTLSTYVEGIEEQQLAIAQGMLQQMDVNISGNSVDDMWNSLDSQISSVLDNIGSIVQYTTSTDDDDQYQEINWDQRDVLRGQILGAFAMRRSVLGAMQAKDDLRNLVHQEMTGIGGRNARTDLASDQLENDAQQTLGWFDETVDATENLVKCKNQIRYEDLEIEKLDKLIQQLEDAKNKSWWSKALNIVAGVCGILAFIPGLQFMAIFAVAAAYASSMISSGLARDTAYTRMNLESTYGTKETIVVDEFDHTTPKVELTTDDAALQLAADAENSISAIFDAFTSSNYLHNVGTAYSIFDSAEFAKQAETVRDYNLQALVAQAAKNVKDEMRNLTHMEMTGIGGRSQSNMANYGIEAARGQQAIVMNGAFNNLSDVNQTRNAQKDLALRVTYLTKLYQNANTSLNWSYLPLLGGAIGNVTGGLNDLYAQRDDATTRSAGSYTTDATFTDDVINNLLLNGTTDSGDGNKMIDASVIAEARTTYTKAFVAVSVEASIRKMLRDIRSLTHQEMTGIRSATGGDLSEKANAVNFETAMRTLNMVSNYLQQKLSIENKINDATQTLANVNEQIKTSEAGAVWATLAGIAAAVLDVVFFGSGEGLLAVLGTIASSAQAASAAMSVVGSITMAVKSWYNYNHYANMSNEMPDISKALAKLRAAVQDNANSVEGSMEKIEQEAIDEIASLMIGSSIGGGAIGVNRGLASTYKNKIDKLYKQQRMQNSVAQALSALRSMVHETMTGISSASMNATANVLNINQESIKAQIDTMFDGLQGLVDRWNQIKDTQRAAELAKIQAIAATITAAIDVAIYAIEQTIKYSKVHMDSSKADKNVQSAENSGTFTNAEGNTVTIADSEKLTKIASLKVDAKAADDAFSAYSASFNTALIALDVAKIIVPVAMAYYEKAAMQDFDEKQKANTDSQFGTVAVGSAVIAEEGGTGDLDQMAASADVAAGKTQLESEALKNTVLKQAEIDAKFNDAIERAKETLLTDTIPKEVTKEIVKHLPQDKTSPARTKSDLEKSLVAAGVDPSAAHKLAESPSVSKFLDNMAKEKDVTKLAASARALTSEINNFISSYKPVEQRQSANTSNSLARLESIMNSVTGLTAQIASAEKAMPQDPQLQTQTQKDLMKALQIRLANEKAELSKILAEKTTLTQSEIPNAQAQVKSYEEEMNKQNKDLFSLITDLEADLMGLENLEKGLKGDATDVKTKEIIEKQKDKIKAEMSHAKVAYEVAKAKYELGKGVLNVLDGKVKELEDSAGKTKSEIGKIQEDIKALNKQITQQGMAQQKNGQGSRDGKNKDDTQKHQVDYNTPLFKATPVAAN